MQLIPPAPGDRLVTASVTADGRAVGLWADPAAAAALIGEGGSRPATTLDRPVTVRATLQAPTSQPTVITIDELALAHPHIAVLPGDQILVVGARCAWTPEQVEPNAIVFSDQGTPLHRAVVGDGVAQVCTTGSGQVWIGYFDEGVYGNFGWSAPGGPSAIGERGLLRFDSRLELQWTFPDIDPRIDDLYAMNVSDDAVWISYYYDFPVVRVQDDVVTVWPTELGELHSVSNLLVSSDQSAVALIDSSRVTIGRLGQHRFEPVRTSVPGVAFERGTVFVARGSVLNIISPTGEWSTTDLAALGDRPTES